MTAGVFQKTRPAAGLHNFSFASSLVLCGAVLASTSPSLGVAYGYTLLLAIFAGTPSFFRRRPRKGIGRNKSRSERKPTQIGRGVIASPAPKGEIPTVTVIIPVRNTVRFLRSAVESALASEEVSVTVLLLDDASTDGSTELARQLQKEYAAVRFKQSLQNLGPFFLRNVGLNSAATEYVAFLDSDDVQEPSRLRKQIAPLLANPKTIATYCQARRWSEDLSEPVAATQIGYITPVFRKSLTREIGYFDSVYFGGDAEFRNRLLAKYGAEQVIEIPEVLYKLRFREGSLTSSGVGQITALDGAGRLTRSNSPARIKYQNNYKKWHQRDSELFMPFPLRERPFEVGDPSQSASPFLGDKIFGFLASFPDRDKACQRAIKSFINQVDEVHLHLNGYTEVPDWTKRLAIHAYLSPENDLKEVGKFAHQNEKRGYLVTLDDDIDYPEDYVSQLLIEIELTNRASVVGVHGIVYSRDSPSLFDNRDIDCFWRGSEGRWVDALGTGTLGYHSTTIGFDVSDFPRIGIADMFVSYKCIALGVPMFSVERKEGWLIPIGTTKDTRLYQVNLKNQIELDDIFRGTYAQNLGEKASAPLVPTQSTKITVIATGWNCEDYVEKCLDSIASATEGIDAEVAITVVDDGSTDNTQNIIRNHPLFVRMNLLTNDVNRGSAFSRNRAIKEEVAQESIMVLIDMDDTITSDSVTRVQDCYEQDSRVWMTLGNWMTEQGQVNPQGFYSPMQISENAHRWMRPFNGTHLRTFKRFLYDRIPKDYFLGEDGQFLRYCTDAALVLPLLDQCGPENVRWIPDPIYVYRKNRRDGTIALAKSAGVDKLNILDSISAKPPLSPFSMHG